MSNKQNDEFFEAMREATIRICPYCKQEAGGLGGGDEVLDYCAECDVIIEGQTIEVDELEYIERQKQYEWWQYVDDDIAYQEQEVSRDASNNSR